MKTAVLVLMLCLATVYGMAQATTTIPGSLRINDSLQVNHNIHSAGNIRALGEVVSADTMRAQKDVIVEGNAVIRSDLNVIGSTKVAGLNVSGPLTINSISAASVDPCVKILMAETGNGGDHVITLAPAQIAAMENAFDQNPCPQPPVIPFTWQTYGNHANSHQRWIGTIDPYDFNIKTSNDFRLVCKANGDIGLGAFGGNTYNTMGKKYRLFIANSGEISAGMQDGTGRYPFVIGANGATCIGIHSPTVNVSPYMLSVLGAVNIGTPFPMASPYLLTVNGRIGAREIKVSIQNPWPDYVFDKGYKPESLENVQRYINLHRHLPGVPSAQTMSKETCGLNLAEMQGIQMEKIEEIYLYLIDMDKRLKVLQKENILLKQLITN